MNHIELINVLAKNLSTLSEEVLLTVNNVNKLKDEINTLKYEADMRQADMMIDKRSIGTLRAKVHELEHIEKEKSSLKCTHDTRMNNRG